jgi:polar amino acid transport system substrate-binding protein
MLNGLSTLLLCLSMMAASGSHAAQTSIIDQTLSLAFYEAGHLYSNGMGIDKDVVDEVKNRGGYSFDYIERPRARIWKGLKEGALAMTVSGIQNAERDEFAYFIPYIAQKNMALVTNPRYQSLEDVFNDRNARIAVVRGFKHGDTYDRLIEQIGRNGGVNEVPTVRNLFLMLNAGNRVDLIISLPVFYNKELEEMGLDTHLTIRDWAPHTSPIVHSLVLSKKFFSEEESLVMATIVQEMRDDGTLRRIFSKYLMGKELEDALNF